MLAGLFLQVAPPAAGARTAAVSVQLVAMNRRHAPNPPAQAHLRQPVPAPARPAGKRMPDHTQAPALAVSGLTRHAEAAHAPKPAARAKPAKAPSPATAVPSSPPPSATAEASAQDMDRVRRHLERFKFYPMSARRRGIGGDVEVGFRLTVGGKAEQVRVLATSGHDILDEAALQTVSRAQPFPVDDGRYRVRLHFRSL